MQPLAEVFGYKIDDMSLEAQRHRQHQLCPYNNRVPSCTKDKANDPLGVCSIYHAGQTAITCPIRFRQDWLVATDAAQFFFPTGTRWTSLTDVRLNDGNGKSAGNIDLVLVAYNDAGKIIDFGALEIQGVYISGNVRRPFTYYMQDAQSRTTMDWAGQRDYPRADYLSSSHKRLAPQLIYKGGILHAWQRRMAVAIDSGFFAELPLLPQVAAQDADVAWLIYDLQLQEASGRYQLVNSQTIYTQFTPALQVITTATPSAESNFLRTLQRKLDEKQAGVTAVEHIPTLLDMFAADDMLEAE